MLTIPNVIYAKCYVDEMLPIPNVKCYLCKMLPRPNVNYTKC